MCASNRDDGGDGVQLPSTSAYAIDATCSREEFLAVAKVYAREVVRATGLSVTVSDLEWEVSMRAKRRAGAVTYRNGTPKKVVLTWEQFDSGGWESMAATIRHELVHVHLLNEGEDPGHGERFRRLADELDTTVHCPRFAEPKWWVRCEDCDVQLARYRRSKLVRNPGRYRCGSCGGSLVVVSNE